MKAGVLGPQGPGGFRSSCIGMAGFSSTAPAISFFLTAWEWLLIEDPALALALLEAVGV